MAPKCNKWWRTLKQGRNKLKKKWKKAFRLKLFELCKTTVRKSIPDILDFFVVLTGRDLSTDIAGFTHAGGISKPHLYKQNVQKLEDIPKIWI